MKPLERIAAQSMPHYLAPSPVEAPAHWLHPDVQMQVFTHASTAHAIMVPAVAEPLLVLVLCGGARVQERELGQGWSDSDVGVDDFFLTQAERPYEMRWQTRGEATFQVVHLYLSQRLLDQAAADLQQHGQRIRLVELSGARDAHVACLVRCIHQELAGHRTPSNLSATGLAQALAVHLVRHYREHGTQAKPRNALPAYQLRRVIQRMEQALDLDLSLDDFAEEAGLSRFYFSRLFHQATGHSPSQFFIRLRMARARELLSSTSQSIIQIALEVGYNSPAHFAQVFRRHTGMTPREYRQQ
ncbi:helix-turn-helix transcriptional regulator [Pseudomonas sp. SDO5271_S396]